MKERKPAGGAFVLPAGAWWGVAPTSRGWLVSGPDGVGLVSDGWQPLAVRGPVRAHHFDGARSWFVAEGGVWIHDAEGTRRAIDLAVLGDAATMVRFLTNDGDDVLLTSPAPGHAAGALGLRRIDHAGRLIAQLEIAGTHVDVAQTVRTGDAIRTVLRGSSEEIVLGLDLSTPQPPLGLVLAEGTGTWRERWVACVRDTEDWGGWPKLEVRDGRALATVVKLDCSPNCVAVGDGWMAWSSAKRLTVRYEDGRTMAPRTGGWVQDLASSGRELAILVGSKPPRLLVVRP